MKKILLVIFLFFYCINSSLFTYALSIDLENNIKSQIDILYSNYTSSLDKIWIEQKNNTIKLLDNKLVNMITNWKLSEKNKFIITYIHEKNVIFLKDSLNNNSLNVNNIEKITETSVIPKCINWNILINNICQNIEDNLTYINLNSLLKDRTSIQEDVMNIESDLAAHNKDIETQLIDLKQKRNIELNNLIQSDNNAIAEYKEQANQAYQNALNAYTKMWFSNYQIPNYDSWLAELEAQSKYNEWLINSKYEKVSIEYTKIINDNKTKITEIDIRLKEFLIKVNSLKNIIKNFKETWDEKWAISMLTSFVFIWDLIWVDDYVKKNWVQVNWYYRTRANNTKLDNLNCIIKWWSYCY